MIRITTRRLPAALLAGMLAFSPASVPALAQAPVFDLQSSIAQGLQLNEIRTQVAKVTEQLRLAQDQLAQAKKLHDSFNKLTGVNEVASALNTPEFRRHLPNGFSEIEGLIKGQGSGSFASSIEGYLSQSRYYSESASNSFYASELDRIARQVGAKQSIGQAVYDTASKRVDGLETLRRGIDQSRDVKDVLDLSARLQAEQALLQNDVLRMQGLAMVQQAQSDMDAQRERERGRQLVDEMKSALR